MKKEKEYEPDKRKQKKPDVSLPHRAIYSRVKQWPQVLDSILSLVDNCDQFVITAPKT